MSRRNSRTARRNRGTLRIEALEARWLLAAEVTPASPWTNPIEPLDANGDGEVTTGDALVIINQLGSAADPTGSIEVPPPILDGNSMHYDTTGNRELSSLDALWIINALGEIAGVAEQIEQEAPVETLPDSVDIVFNQDYARIAGSLDAQQAEQQFKFVAQRGNIAVDLSSVQDESITEIRVFDELGVEVISDAVSPGRSRFEGIKFRTVVGRQYTILTTLDTLRADSFAFTLDVMQFDLGDWPGVIVSDDPGLAWTNSFGPDTPLGQDNHGDGPDSATPLRPFEREIQFDSNIDTAGDVDWFRISNISNAITVVVDGSAQTTVRFEVFDTGLNRVEPVNEVSQAGETTLGTYLIPPLGEALISVQAVDDSIGQYQFELRDVAHTPIENLPTDSLSVPDEVGDTLADAADVSIQSGNILLNQRLETTDDIDVFRIPNALPGSMIASGIAGIQVEVLDIDGNVLDRSDPVFDLSGRIDVGIYDQNLIDLLNLDSDYVYLRVSSSVGAVGRYEVIFTFKGTVPENLIDFDPIDPSSTVFQPDSQFGDDQHDATPDRATRFPRNDPAVLVSHLDTADDVDTFEFPGYQGMASLSLSVHTDDAIGMQLVVTDHLGRELTPDRIVRDENTYGVYIDRAEVPEFTDRFGATRTRIYVHVSSDRGATGTYTMLYGAAESDSIFGIDAHGATAATATDMGPLQPVHLVRSALDGPSDRDALRFTATFPEMSINLRRLSDKLALRGQGTLHLYDADGNLVQPKSVAEDGFENLTVDTIEKTYDLNVGDEYVIVVLNEQQQAFGRYQVTLQGLGRVLDYLDDSQAETIDVPIGRVIERVISGTIETAGQVDFYRILAPSHHANFRAVTAINPGISYNPIDHRVRMAVYRGADGTLIKSNQGYPVMYGDLPDGISEGKGEYVLAVWMPVDVGYTGDYLIQATFRGPPDLGVDEIGDTIAEAKPIEQASDLVFPPAPGEPIKAAALGIEMDSADDVDVYQVSALESTIRVSMFNARRSESPDSVEPALAELVNVELVDADDNPVPSEVRTDASGTVEFLYHDFTVTAGEQYYLKFSQTTANPLLLSAFVGLATIS